MTTPIEAVIARALRIVDANVDLDSGLRYRMLDLPDDLAVPILIRPLLHDAGPTGRACPPGAHEVR